MSEYELFQLENAPMLPEKYKELEPLFERRMLNRSQDGVIRARPPQASNTNDTLRAKEAARTDTVQ